MKRVAVCLKRTGYAEAKAKTHLKNVFWPNIFVGASRVPAKPLGEAGILNQNPIFETGSNKSLQEF
jgi:hypothetical protein